MTVPKPTQTARDVLVEFNNVHDEQSRLLDQLEQLAEQFSRAETPEESHRIAMAMDQLDALIETVAERCRVINAQLIEQLAAELKNEEEG